MWDGVDALGDQVREDADMHRTTDPSESDDQWARRAVRTMLRRCISSLIAQLTHCAKGLQ